MFRNMKRISLRLLVILLISLFVCSTALASSSAVVNTSALIVRKGASTSAKKVATLGQGTRVEILSTSGSWSKISYRGHTGYAYSKYLSKSTTSGSSSSSRIRAYTTTSASVYSSGTSSSTKLGTVAKGTMVYVVGKSGNYYKVQNSSGSATGYISKSYLSQSKPSGSSSSSSGSSGSKADKVIAAAKAQLGKPYVLASSGMSSFDCSGLTSYCYKQVGVYLSRSAQAQGYNNGSKLSKSELKAGDIVCFDTEDDDSDLSDHVGIYLGGGKFIHASSAAGKVIISNLYSGYYARVFSWGRRVL